MNKTQKGSDCIGMIIMISLFLVFINQNRKNFNFSTWLPGNKNGNYIDIKEIYMLMMMMVYKKFGSNK